MARRPKKPWNADLGPEAFPSLHGLPAHEPKPLPGTVTPQPSTGVVMSPRRVPMISLPGKPGIATYTVTVDSEQPAAAHFVEQHLVQVTLGPDGGLVATEDSRPAQIQVAGEVVEEIPQPAPAPTEE